MLVVVNVVSNRVVSAAWYVPWAVAAVAALLVLARADGVSWSQLGLGRAAVGRGLRWGLVLAGSVVVIYVIGVAIPATRDLFRDDRVDDWSFARTLYAAFVRVPLGTVLLEEVAFRGVLPAVLWRRVGPARAVGFAALAFGLWHILPAIGLQGVNPVTEETVGQLPGWVTVAASVASTAAVGVWFWWLRHRSGSLLAPMALHWATNGLGYLFAYGVWHA